MIHIAGMVDYSFCKCIGTPFSEHFFLDSSKIFRNRLCWSFSSKDKICRMYGSSSSGFDCRMVAIAITNVSMEKQRPSSKLTIPAICILLKIVKQHCVISFYDLVEMELKQNTQRSYCVVRNRWSSCWNKNSRKSTEQLFSTIGRTKAMNEINE